MLSQPRNEQTFLELVEQIGQVQVVHESLSIGVDEELATPNRVGTSTVREFNQSERVLFAQAGRGALRMGRKVQEVSIGREIEEEVEHIDARVLMGRHNRVGKDNRTNEKRAQHVLEVERETRNQNTRD